MTWNGTLERLHPVQRLLADVLAGFELLDQPGPDAGEAALWSLGSGELDALVVGVAGVVDRLRVRHLELVTEAVRRGRPAAVGASSPTVWLAGLLRVTPGSARRTVTDAAVLAAAAGDPVTAPLVADARDGLVGVDQAVIAAAAVAALPAELTGPGEPGDARRAQAVDFLRAQARVLDPDGLRRAADHLAEVIDPDGADARLADALDRADRRAHDTRGLHLGPERDGTVRGRFTLPAADAAVVRAALESLAQPSPTTTGTAVDPGSAPWPRPGEPPLATATTRTRDDRTHLHRMADALVELCERALTHGDLPTTGGERPHLVVLVPLDHLTGSGPAGTGHAGTGRLLHGTLLSPGQLRRLACDSSVLPAVLGSSSQPLDIGRQTRTIPTGLRRALVLRDRGCAFPGCDRPPTWTDAHHIRHWADGGRTSLANLVLLCGHHHRHLHQPSRHPGHPGEHGEHGEQRNWTVHIAPDGHPDWTPPTWTHPPGTTLRNTAHP